MPDAAPKYRLVTNTKQLTAVPPMRTEIVVLKDWKADDGDPFAFMIWELSVADYDACIMSGWDFHPDGSRKKWHPEDADIRLAAFTVRDPGGNRLWGTIEEAKAQLRPLGRSSLDQIIMASNRVNSVSVEDTEGNSGGTPSDSSPTT